MSERREKEQKSGQTKKKKNKREIWGWTWSGLDGTTESVTLSCNSVQLASNGVKLDLLAVYLLEHVLYDHLQCSHLPRQC